MSEQTSGAEGDPGGHGVAGTQRGDTHMEEEPVDPPEVDTETWADQTQTGGQATD